MAINVKDKLVTLESLGVAYSAEQDAREEADQALSTRIDNIVAPEGDPSLTEVSDARVSGSTTHNTLKARLDADKTAIETEISQLSVDLGDLEDRVEALEEGGSGGGSGVPASVKSALVSLFNAIPYTDDMTSEIAIIGSWASEISGISVSPTTASINGSSTTQLVATTTPAGGTVTWESSNTAVATVSSSGLVTGIGNGSATITARCGGYHASCAVTVSGFATLTGITAVYSGGSITDSTTLNDLKADITVTASYDNGTTATVTDYTLSGSLAVGTNTIVVSYGGFTDSFTVTVTSDALYSWDLTDSLTDKVAGRVAVASAGSGVDAPVITSNGIVFNAATQRLSLGEIDLVGKTIEIDVASMSFAGNSGDHVRFLTSGMYTSSNGAGPIVYRASSTVGWAGYDLNTSTNKAGWTAKWFNGGIDAFSGKTVKLVSKADNTRELYLDNELVGTIATHAYGTYTKDIAIGGCTTYSQSSGDQCYNMTISGIRIKNNPAEVSE